MNMVETISDLCLCVLCALCDLCVEGFSERRWL